MPKLCLFQVRNLIILKYGWKFFKKAQNTLNSFQKYSECVKSSYSELLDYLISILLALYGNLMLLSAQFQQLRQTEKVWKVVFYDFLTYWVDVTWNISSKSTFGKTPNLSTSIFLCWLPSKHSEARANRRCSTFKLEPYFQKNIVARCRQIPQ